MHKKSNPRKNIFFLDIDGTLITPSQKTNTRSLPALIRKLSKKGVCFGLNSNRSIEDLTSIYKKFSLNGPIIAENGVYYKSSISGKKNFLIPQPPDKIKEITYMSIKKFIENEKIKPIFKMGDSTKIISSKKMNMDSPLIIANGYRLYTGNIHLYNNRKRDPALAQRLKIFLEKEFKIKKLSLRVESSRIFSNVMFCPQKADKGNAVRELKKIYTNSKFYMAGDDVGDLETLKYIDGFFAVGNAEKKVKESAAFTSAQEYTKGVLDILRHFEKKYL
jgi:HAD superfamily hydrolase (TIGR01484 family)